MRALNNSQLSKQFVDWPVYMAQAIDLACLVWTASPNPRVGCVIVDDSGEILARGWHVGAGHDHAEIVALKNAGSHSLTDATVFVSLEPCSHQGRTGPCAHALAAAGVKRVVIAMVDPNPRVSGHGVRVLEEAGIEVIHLCDFEEQARSINRGFCKRMEQGLPYVSLKLAMSLDGRTALANGVSQWISGEEARADVQRLRACADAIITGSGTALADDPRLTVRTEQLALNQQEAEAAQHALAMPPLRVLLDSKLRTPATARLFDGSSALVFTAAETGEHGLPDTAEVLAAPQAEDGVDLRFVLESLAQRECNDVLIEAGATLAGSFLRQALVDEVVVYIAPKLLGSDARPLLTLSGLTELNDSPRFSVVEHKQVGADIRIRLTPDQ